jgi:hypothetical protein
MVRDVYLYIKDFCDSKIRTYLVVKDEEAMASVIQHRPQLFVDCAKHFIDRSVETISESESQHQA